MNSTELREQFPYVWTADEPAGYKYQHCRRVQVIAKGRAVIRFLDGREVVGSLRSCRPINANPKKRPAAGKTEAVLALEIRGHLQTLNFRVHRLKADKYKGSHQKAHETEEPGTPDYICHGFRTLPTEVAAFMWGKSITGMTNGGLMPVTFYWEAKREKNGQIGVNQRAWIDDARKRGFVVLEAPRSIEEVDKWLEEQGWHKK